MPPWFLVLIGFVAGVALTLAVVRGVHRAPDFDERVKLRKRLRGDTSA